MARCWAVCVADISLSRFASGERFADTREFKSEGGETGLHVVEAALDVRQTATELVAEPADALVHVLFASAHGLEKDLVVGADEAAGLGFDNLVVSANEAAGLGFDNVVVGADEVADLVEVFLGYMPPVRSGRLPA